LRAKHLDTPTRERIARELVALCRERGVPLLINDDIALAAVVGATGVHLGREDADIASARRALGARALIGVSCYNEIGRARAAAAAGADYVAFGRFFPSHTKPLAVQASLELLRAARTELSLPIVAIGGITPENGGSLIAAGADALAVIEGIFNQPDIRAAAARYARLFSTTADSP
jgi:thiamine-phosphate pyrophosphorylase